MSADAENIVEISDLSLEYRARGRVAHPVLTDVSVSIPRGSILALVGESGSGKSTLARTITGTLARNAHLTQGSVTLNGRELVGLPQSQYARLRGRTMGYVPQDALLGLNPLQPVGRQAGEPLRAHTTLDAEARRHRVLELFERVGLRRVEQVYESYPHELSGGMCQRVLIAAAIAADPQLIIADEPTTALDVTVQKRILDLLVDLTRDEGLSVLLVTHDLGVAVERAERVAVLQHGRLVEEGQVTTVVDAPVEAYTRRLIASSGLGRSLAEAAETRARRIDAPTLPAPASASSEAPLVLAESISKAFSGRHGDGVQALDQVSVRVARGSTLGIVGESGSGKTTLMRTLAGLIQPDTGEVRIAGVSVDHALNQRDRRKLYRKLQIVYQNSYAALNPKHTVATILNEPLTGYGLGGRDERRNRIAELLDLTGLPATVGSRYTAELSGGQRQRVAIARALAVRPEVILCDEPVSALDVTVQQQILDLLVALQRELGLTYLFISHDLGVISEISDDVLVMQHGAVVESGPALQVLRSPRTPYVRELIEAIPRRAPATDDTLHAAGTLLPHNPERQP